MNSVAFKFLKGECRDFKGRSLRDMQFFTDFQIERDNAAIPWMFPIDKESKHNPEVSPLFSSELDEFRTNNTTRCSLKFSAKRMYMFYDRNATWITQKNHNFIRLARILRCLWLADLKTEYVHLQKLLDEAYLEYSNVIGVPMFLHWKCANDNNFDLDLFHKLTDFSAPNTKPKMETLNKGYSSEDLGYF